MESRPRQEYKGVKKTNTKVMSNGGDVCWKYNSRNGCKRTAIPGGCKTNHKEFSHACNVWMKDRNKYCLLPHSRRDHK